MADEGGALLREVGALLRTVAADEVLPLFRRLDQSQVERKARGELVTVADRAAERVLTERLPAIVPGSRVVGEEAVAEDEAVLDRLRQPGPVWLVDPVDGTANFAAGRRPFKTMVALLVDGTIRASWIFDPVDGQLVAARAGGGTEVDGSPVRSADHDDVTLSELRGALMYHSLPRALRHSVRDGTRSVGRVLPGHRCAGQEYVDIVTGRQHFVLFCRTLPWDHAPGALLVEQAGGVVRRLDGSRYDPTDERSGLLVAASERIWDTLSTALLSPPHPG